MFHPGDIRAGVAPVLPCRSGVWRRQVKDWTSINPTIVWSQQIQGRGAQWYWVDLDGQLPAGAREAAFSVYLETGRIACDQLKSVRSRAMGPMVAVSRLLLLHTYHQNS